MWNGKSKAVTFSFDDGTTQDKRLIYLLDKYGLRATFNLNSGLMGRCEKLERGELRPTVPHIKLRADEIARVYSGHEVAVHGVKHIWLPDLDDKGIISEVEDDRRALSEIVGYEVVGMAYSCHETDDEHIREVIRKNTGVKYARALKPTYSFDMPDELLCIHPTTSQFGLSEEKTYALIDKFFASESEKPQMFYIWGHSFEYDNDPYNYDRIEKLLRYISGNPDVYYGTNSEVLL